MDHAPVISIVDDDDGVRRSLDGLVRSLGYKVAAFSSAESFLASDHARSCQCVISDVQMPGGMSGFDLTREIVVRGYALPVILISAFADEKAQSLARDAGALHLLKKPFDGEALVACLTQALEP